MYKIFIFLLCFILLSCKDKQATDVQTTLVKRGAFKEELTEEGTLKAAYSINLSAPSISYRYGSLKITSMITDGKDVDRGDTLIVFDQSEIKKSIISSQQQLEIAKAEFEKLKATQQSEIEDLESDLEIARISQEISKINFEQAVYESEVAKKEINLKLESANIALSRAKEQIENKKKIHEEDIFQKSINLKQLTSLLEDADKTISNLFVVSPSQGIAILKDNWMTSQKWQVGDQPYPGTALAELPDMTLMLAEVKINEVDISKIKPGLKVEIRPDAYSDTMYYGKIETMANLAQNKDSKSKIKVFPVQISIDGISENLLPGLTVSCNIIINELNDVVYIPVESIFKDEDGTSYVYLKSSSGYKRKNIVTGSVNTDFVVVSEGLDEKDEIALSDPFKSEEENIGKNEI